MKHPWGPTWESSAPEDPRDWRADAACAQTDPDMFMPGKGGSMVGARMICAGCEVAAQCLQWALDNNVRQGIYGGLSERQRDRLRRAS